MKKSILNYKSPARKWIEALPLGSGQLGVMMESGVRQSKLGLNLDTLWSGEAKNKNNPSPNKDWQWIQKAIFAEKYQEAEDYCKENILGDWTECYLPAGNLRITHLEVGEQAANYQRKLELNRAIHNVSFDYDGTGYEEESFVCFPKDMLCMRFSAKRNQQLQPISLELALDCPLQHEVVVEEAKKQLILLGKAPSYAAPDYFEVENPIRYEENKGMAYALCLKADVRGGQCVATDKGLLIRDAREIVLYLCGQTTYNTEENVMTYCRDKLSDCSLSTYETLRTEHCNYFQPIFERVELELGETESKNADDLPDAFWRGKDKNGIYSLMFDYARYLLMSSSKPGTEPANLQGIWNSLVRAPWSSNYTVNINTQMNYWIAESTNLSEFHLPLFDLLEKVAKHGRITAQELYGQAGWVSHHNIDIWGHSSPVGFGASDENPCVYSLWNMSGAWLCRHLWEHFQYTGDICFLREKVYPLIEGAVTFFLGYLTEYQDYLVTIPSTSPENKFLDQSGNAHALTFASTMDVAILREMFDYYQKIRQILKLPFDERVEQALRKLPPYQIGKNGQLKEWFTDYQEWDVNHRHVSHLYGLYPSDTIGFAENKDENERLKQACKTSLLRREDEGTGWCMAWKACLWARLGDGERVLKLLQRQLRLTEEETILMKGGGIYPNLFSAHPPFQIDGNFGFATAIVEMLLQSHEKRIKLLPALPKEWEKGYVKGLKAKGGFTLSFSWENHRLQHVEITADKAGSIWLEHNGEEEEIRFTEDSLMHSLSF